MSSMLDLTLKLCFVKRNFAWFTSCPVSFQWGDDWDESPYEYNAGEPYAHHETKDGKKQDHTVVKVYWEAPYVTPDALDEKSKWSVKSINRGNIAWLSSSSWSDQELSPIHSGTSLEDFIKHIQSAGGEVFIPIYEKLEATTDTPKIIPKHKQEKSELKSKSKKKKKSK